MFEHPNTPLRPCIESWRLKENDDICMHKSLGIITLEGEVCKREWGIYVYYRKTLVDDQDYILLIQESMAKGSR